ncbi:MAG: tannase/feruloyl esterase family alpha/beta hydrolase [Pseudomonadota bacterium]
MLRKNQLRATLLLWACVCACGAYADPACQKLYRLTDLSWAVEPGMVMPAAAGIPEHCRLRGVVNRAIQVEVRMPVEGWNGRIMFSTVGGGAGSIGDTTSLLSRGFAMASTDTGHEGQDMTFMLQPEALLDYAYRGVHLATVFTKAAVEAFYGEAARYSYLNGCSNGGRAALMEALRFPDDYDGIIAGAPAFRFQEFASWMVGGARQQAQHPLTAEALAVLDANSRRACDALDGVDDGVINDPRECDEDRLNLDALACGGGRDSDCLTAGQIETARYMYADQFDSAGNLVSPGVLPGAEDAGDWAFWMLENSLLGSESLIGGMADTLTMMMRREPGFDINTFDPNNDRAQLTPATMVTDVESADLTEFEARGGKLLMYQGWNDYPLRPQRAIAYLEQAQQRHGGAEKTADFFRLFMVPGMVHCVAGPGAWVADYVDPLVEWRENGKAPDRIEASSGAKRFTMVPEERSAQDDEPFTRPLCAYPELARFKGRGDVDKASSYVCE